jgi:hypothetical protein
VYLNAIREKNALENKERLAE